MILDTSVIIEKVKNREVIKENITSVSLIEYPPIKDYEKFRGRVFFFNEEDQVQAVLLQVKLREIGSPMSAGDLLIAAVCVNRNEALLTKDKDFLVIQKVEPRLRIILED